jgi:hypothetical protein
LKVYVLYYIISGTAPTVIGIFKREKAADFEMERLAKSFTEGRFYIEPEYVVG